VNSTVNDEIEWARLPDIEKKFGLRRSKLYELISTGEVRSSCIRRKGAMTGVRLIDVESVRELLRANIHNDRRGEPAASE